MREIVQIAVEDKIVYALCDDSSIFYLEWPDDKLESPKWCRLPDIPRDTVIAMHVVEE